MFIFNFSGGGRINTSFDTIFIFLKNNIRRFNALFDVIFIIYKNNNIIKKFIAYIIIFINKKIHFII